MFKSMKRIIRWAGKYKGRLYLGSVCSFFSSLSTAIPTMAAAFALDKAIQAYWTNTAIDTVLIWQMLGIIIGSIALNFLILISGQYCRRALDMKWPPGSVFIWAMY